MPVYTSITETEGHTDTQSEMLQLLWKERMQKKKASSCDFFLFVSASMTCISLPCTCGVCNDNKDEFYSILFFYIVLVVTPIFLVNTATASYVLTAGMNGWICVMMAWQ